MRGAARPGSVTGAGDAMAFVPRFSLLFKILFRIRDRAAAEGLFLRGSVAFEEGEFEDARMIFAYGKSLDPTLAGNHYNYAVTLQRLGVPVAQRRRAWEEYLAAAAKDPKQSEDHKRLARQELERLKNSG